MEGPPLPLAPRPPAAQVASSSSAGDACAKPPQRHRAPARRAGVESRAMGSRDSELGFTGQLSLRPARPSPGSLAVSA
jgi:hypothetical protein